jgi:hypothetical protein
LSIALSWRCKRCNSASATKMKHYNKMKVFKGIGIGWCIGWWVTLNMPWLPSRSISESPSTDGGRPAADVIARLIFVWIE